MRLALSVVCLKQRKLRSIWLMTKILLANCQNRKITMIHVVEINASAFV